MKAWAKIAQFLHMRNGKQCRERTATTCAPSSARASGRSRRTPRSGTACARWARSGRRSPSCSCRRGRTTTSRTGGTRSSGSRRRRAAASGPTRRPSSAWPSSATRRARRCPVGRLAPLPSPPPPPRRRTPAPARPAQHTTARRSPAAPRAASQERKRERQRHWEEKRKTQQPKSKHQPRAAHADGAMDDGESPSRGRRLFRSPNAGSPSGGALAEGALGASAPNSESLRRYFGEAAGDSVGTPAPVTAAAVGAAASPAGSAASLLRAAARARASIMGSPCSFLGSPGTFEISAETFDVGAALGGVGETLASTGSPPPASSARRCRWRSRWWPTARRSRRRAATGAGRRRVAVAPRLVVHGAGALAAARGRIERGRIERRRRRKGVRDCARRGEATGESRRRGHIQMKRRRRKRIVAVTSALATRRWYVVGNMARAAHGGGGSGEARRRAERAHRRAERAKCTRGGAAGETDSRRVLGVVGDPRLLLHQRRERALCYEKLRKSGSTASSSSDDAHRLMRGAPSGIDAHVPPGVVGVTGVARQAIEDIGFFEAGHDGRRPNLGDPRRHVSRARALIQSTSVEEEHCCAGAPRAAARAGGGAPELVRRSRVDQVERLLTQVPSSSGRAPRRPACAPECSRSLLDRLPR